MPKPRNTDLNKKQLESYIVARTDRLTFLLKVPEQDDEQIKLVIADLYESGLKRYTTKVMEEARMNTATGRLAKGTESMFEKKYLGIISRILIFDMASDTIADDLMALSIADIYEGSCRIYGVPAMAAARENIWQRDEWLRAGRCGSCGAELPDWDVGDGQIADVCLNCLAKAKYGSPMPKEKIQ